MSKKAIPNGDFDFATMAQSFAQNLAADPGLYEIESREVEQLAAAVERYKSALQNARFGSGRSRSATRAKDDARREVELMIRKIRHLVKLNSRIPSASKVLLNIGVHEKAPKTTTVPPEAPRLRFVRALHESGASPMHELEFRSFDTNKSRPEGAVRLELFVDLVPPDEPIPTHPGVNQGGRPWYLRSYSRSPIVLAPPMPRVPMRVVYWGRWADSAGAVGPFSATCAAWIEGGSHHYLPGSPRMQIGREPTQLLDPPVLPQRDQKYSVAVLEVHCQSFMPTLVEQAPREAPRQLEAPAEEAA